MAMSAYALVEPPVAVAFDSESFRGLVTAEIARGEVMLPSFPDVAQRLQRILEGDRATSLQVARVLGADAALAARVLRIANAAMFNPTGKPLTELPAAVGRLGLELVRSAAISFSLRQMKLVDADSELRPVLQELWKKGTLVAAIGYVLARATGRASPDEALVAGLLHNIGRLYLLIRGNAGAGPITEPDVWDRIVHDCHPAIGRAILQHWKFPEGISMAVAEQHAWDLPERLGGPLGDVLIAANSLVPCVFYRELLDDAVTSVAPFGRLGLDVSDCSRLLTATAPHIKSLRDALAG